MLSFFDALNLILDDKAADHDDFKNILLLGHVEEKRIMSLAKRNKISNINFLDLNNEFDAGSFAAFFTNLTNDDTLIVKYNQYLEEEQKEILNNAVKYRKIKLIVGEGNAAQNVEIDLNEFNIILSLDEGSEISKDFYDMFTLKINVGVNSFNVVEFNNVGEDEILEANNYSDIAGDQVNSYFYVAKNKKSFYEIQGLEKNDKFIYVETCYRMGEFILDYKLDETELNDDEIVIENFVDASYFDKINVEFEWDDEDDSENSIFESAWNTEGISGVEELGWNISSQHLKIVGGLLQKK